MKNIEIIGPMGRVVLPEAEAHAKLNKKDADGKPLYVHAPLGKTEDMTKKKKTSKPKGK